MIELDIQKLVNEFKNIREGRNAIITMHLFIESLVNKFLEEYFPKPKKLPKFFMQKYNLLRALELPKSENLNKNILRINEIRTRFAHNLDAQLVMDDFEDLQSNLPGQTGFDQAIDPLTKFHLLGVDVLLNLEYELNDFLRKNKK